MNAGLGIQAHVLGLNPHQIICHFFVGFAVPNLTGSLEKVRVILIRWPAKFRAAQANRVPLGPTNLS